MKSSKILLLMYLATIGIACKSVQPRKPLEIYQSMQENLVHSNINLPVTLNLADIEKSINDQVSGLLYDDDSFKNNDNDKLKIKAYKRADIRIGFNDQQITYIVPLKLWIQKRTALTDLTAEGELELFFNTDFEIRPNWDLITLTTVDNFKWTKKPVLKLGLVDIPIKFIGNKVLRESKHIVSQAIDQQLKDQFELKAVVKQAWQTLQDPILLSEEFRVWLTFDTQKISMSPLKVINGNLSSRINLEAITAINIGNKPSQLKNKRLPDLEQGDSEINDLQLMVKANITYEEGERLAKAHLIGQRFGEGRRMATIEDIKLYGQNEKLVVEVKLSGAFDGNVFFTGIPQYNSTTNEIYLQGLNYELKTKNFLMKSMAWLFKSKIKNTLADRLKFPLGENLDKIKALIKAQLNHYQVNPYLEINGELFTFDIQETTLTPEGITLLVQAKGKLDLLVTTLN